MITLFRSNIIYSLDQLKSLMSDQIKRLLYTVTCVGTPQTILRYELFCEPIDLLTWLHNQPHDNKLYWSDRHQNFEIAGIDEADSIEGEGQVDYQKIFDYMNQRLSSDNQNLKYYGGITFNQNACDRDWQKYGSCRFQIPQFELYSSNKKTVFALNIAMKDICQEGIERLLKSLDQINFSTQTTYRSVPVIQSRRDFPNHEEWKNIFNKIMASNGQCYYEKIVLARKSIFTFDKYINPVALLKHLKDMTPDCFHFCFQPASWNCFLGASPERLYKRRGRTIQSEAIAGTTPRGNDNEEDEWLKDNLLKSLKNQHEHKLVVHAIHDVLTTLCSSLESEETPQLLKLKYGHHLITHFQGELLDDVTDDQIIGLLHPTPAVAGIPKKEVLKVIENLEPFTRGWYAGPVGYVGHQTAEFAVAIRSGLVSENNLSLFAGAGIVTNSTVEDEWREIENKITSFIKVFDQKTIEKDARY